MVLSEMITLLEFYIDDVADQAIAVQLFNAGKNRMSIECGIDYPDITTANALSDSFAFDAKFHEMPVIYAAAMYKSADSSIQEKNSLLSQFEQAIPRFVQHVEASVTDKQGSNVAQFTGTQGQTDFLVTKEGFSPRFTEMKVYVNGIQFYGYEKFVYDDPRIIVIPGGVQDGDKVTILWEPNDVWNDPPAFYPKGW